MAVAERPLPTELLAQRVEKYIPSREILEAYPFPDPVSLQRKEIVRRTLRGAAYSLVYSHLEGKLIMVPTWHPLNTTLIPSHAADYGSGVFEGHSIEPVVRDGAIVGANLILHNARMQRLERSMRNRDFGLPVPMGKFSLGLIDLASVHGEEVLRSPEGKPSRAYVRPEARPSLGGFGLGVKKGHLIEVGGTLWFWPFYFNDPERVYNGSGLVVAAFPEQRLSRISGKHASNYGEAGVVGNRARVIEGIDEAVYFAPYIVNPRTSRIEYTSAQQGKEAALKILRFGAFADGPGEEVFAISSSGEIWYPPLNVNRLGGTTLNYLIEHIAPALNIPTREKPFTMHDIKTGSVVSLLFAGNAARIAPIGEIRRFASLEKAELLDTTRLEITPLARILIKRWEDEVSARIPASDYASLLTPVPLDAGKEARDRLDEVFAAWL